MINVRWEGRTLVVEKDGEETRFENAYVKDPPYDSPEEKELAPIDLNKIETVLDRCTLRLDND